MKSNVLGALAVLLGVAPIGFATAQTEPRQADSDLRDCIRTVMQLDEGRWNYMGTIARIDGTFRTYEATSVHERAGEDSWSSKSFGGDVGGTEEGAQGNRVVLDGNRLVPVVNGERDYGSAIEYLSCVGPDAEGRYEVRTQYKIPNGDDTFDLSRNVAWYSEHGSYYAEDHYSPDGRIVSRRSGVNTPAQGDGSPFVASPD